MHQMQSDAAILTAVSRCNGVLNAGGARGRPAREVLENPCAEHFILFQVACCGVEHVLQPASGCWQPVHDVSCQAKVIRVQELSAALTHASHALHQVGLLRDYLELEFQQPAEVLGFKYDLERVIDDFVLFCMLIGNDFLPCEAQPC
jgi:Xrn1 helical domain